MPSLQPAPNPALKSAMARSVLAGLVALAAGLSLAITAEATGADEAVPSAEDGSFVVAPAPAAPTGLTARPDGDGRIALDWADNVDAFGRYQVYRDGNLIADGPIRSDYVDEGLENGRLYEYRVSAGTMPTVSEWTDPAQATPTDPRGATSVYAPVLRRCRPA
jgi:hypothetical protein